MWPLFKMTTGEIAIAIGVTVWFVGMAIYVWLNRYAGTAAMEGEAKPEWLRDDSDA